MRKPLLVPSLLSMAALALLLVLSPVVRGQSASATASVHVKLAVDPTGMFLVGKPAVPIVKPHRITLGLSRGGVLRTRVFGLGAGRVVYVGQRAPTFILIGSPVAVVGTPVGVVGGGSVGVVGSPGVVVGSPGVVVGSPGVVVNVGAPAVVVGVPGVVVGGGVRVVQPVVVVPGGGKHDNGKHNGHRKHGRH